MTDRLLHSQALTVFIPLLALLSAPSANAQTAQDLWLQYAAEPNRHALIPNNSYAGYRACESALPPPSGPVFDVTASEFGADDSGVDDCTAAIQAAIDAAGAEGGGTVQIPAGTYRIEGLIHLRHDRTVIRGAGRDQTVLDFRRSLEEIDGPFGSGSSRWSWSGGLVWISPDDTFDGGGRSSMPGAT